MANMFDGIEYEVIINFLNYYSIKLNLIKNLKNHKF